MARSTRRGRIRCAAVPSFAKDVSREEAAGPRGERPEAAVESERLEAGGVRESSVSRLVGGGGACLGKGLRCTEMQALDLSWREGGESPRSTRPHTSASVGGFDPEASRALRDRRMPGEDAHDPTVFACGSPETSCP